MWCVSHQQRKPQHSKEANRAHALIAKMATMKSSNLPKSKNGYQIYLSRDWFEIAIEAPSTRGLSDGNPDYNSSFERVLSRLGSMDALLLGAMLNTRHTSTSSISSRILTHPKLKYPVPLATAVPSELRIALTKIAMKLHSSARSESSGSARRRISLFVRIEAIPHTELGVDQLRRKLSRPARYSRLGF